MAFSGAILLCLVIAQAPATSGTSGTPVSSTPPTEHAGISISLAAQSERVTYHFTNASTFDTTALVPHFFEQQYDSGRVLVTAKGRYRLFGSIAATSVTLTPTMLTAGSDIDTFVDPNGDVITSGTNGSVRLGSIGVRQDVPLGDGGGWRTGFSVGYRRARADFPPDDRIVTHTQPASITRTFITDREITFSEVLDVGVSAARARALGASWTASADLRATPLISARLTTQLPDKYPGQNIVFTAVAFGAGGSMRIDHAIGALRAGVQIDAAFARGYRNTADYRSRTMAVGMFLSTR